MENFSEMYIYIVAIVAFFIIQLIKIKKGVTKSINKADSTKNNDPVSPDIFDNWDQKPLTETKQLNHTFENNIYYPEINKIVQSAHEFQKEKSFTEEESKDKNIYNGDNKINSRALFKKAIIYTAIINKPYN